MQPLETEVEYLDEGMDFGDGKTNFLFIKIVMDYCLVFDSPNTKYSIKYLLYLFILIHNEQTHCTLAFDFDFF